MESLDSAGDVEQPSIPGYKILERIGAGGMGVVFRACQLSLQRLVAIKVMRTPTCEPPAEDAFRRESYLMASLAHPHIVAIYDYGLVGTSPYLVMENITGSSLREQIHRGHAWPIAEAAATVASIAEALIYIHDKEILHLDLKPENVLVDPSGNVKITDFGLALHYLNPLDRCGPLHGSIDYCSPEQRYGLPVDPRSDLFSLAVLTYELLTGHLPGRVYRSCREDNPRLPTDLDDVLRRGLERDPNDRYANVAEFRNDLIHAITGASRRKKRLLVGMAAMLMAFAAIAHSLSRTNTGDAAQTQDNETTSAWVIYEDQASLSWLRGEGTVLHTPQGTAVVLRPSEQPPRNQLDQEVPRWPSAMPAVVIRSPGAWGFICTMGQNPCGQKLLDFWPRLHKLPPIPGRDNWLSQGDFSGCTLGSSDDAPWGLGSGKPGPSSLATIEKPFDQPDNPALILTKTADSPAEELATYQYLSKVPSKPGTLMVLRFRARAMEGEALLGATVLHQLLIPRNDSSTIAKQVRSGLHCVPSQYVPSTPEATAYCYRPGIWVQPTPIWKSYILIWEWPPYCQKDSRVLQFDFAGNGKVAVDDVELFPWESVSDQ